MPDSVIKVTNLAKRYVLAHDEESVGGRFRYKRFSDVLVQAVKAPFRALRKKQEANPHREEFWALKDVSFEVKPGEVIGIIGRNGAGKSTLLKILSRITEPTSGRVEIEGRVASLLEVGTGFHPELTGRENIYLNGAILGMTRAEIRRKFDEIVAFAQVEKFLDTPVKHFSSGMYVRLAFSVAAHLEPEILIVDEVLAVGDAEFQKKCLGKMRDVAVQEGRTVLFVSHNIAAIHTLCSSAILLAKGRIEAVGTSTEVVTRYLQEISEKSNKDLDGLKRIKGNEDLKITAISLQGDSSQLQFGQNIAFVLSVTANRSFSDLSIGCSIFHQDETCIGTMFTSETFDLAAGEEKKLCLTLKDISLAPGSYHAGFSIGNGGLTSPRQDYDIVIGAPTFEIIGIPQADQTMLTWNRSWGGIFFKNHQLSVTSDHGKGPLTK